MLFVKEFSQVMLYFKSPFHLAVLTGLWLLDFSIEELNDNFIVAIGAFKMGSLHFGYDLRSPNNDSPDRYEPINLPLVNFLERNSLIQRLDRKEQIAHLNGLILHQLWILLVANKQPAIQLLQYLIRDHKHLCGEIDKLIVKLGIKLLEMPALNGKHIGLIKVELDKLRVVDLLRDLLLVCDAGDLEVQDEGLHALAHLVLVDVCTVY